MKSLCNHCRMNAGNCIVVRCDDWIETYAMNVKLKRFLSYLDRDIYTTRLCINQGGTLRADEALQWEGLAIHAESQQDWGAGWDSNHLAA